MRSTNSFILLTLASISTIDGFIFLNSRWGVGISNARLHLSNKAEAPQLLPDPLPNSIGNFFDNKTVEMSFIQCYMLSVGKIEGVQYGVGFPVDMPVMLSYFEGNELIPVRPDYPDFDHLVNHVSNQLDSSDLQLYQTPVVLTLQGEFEDEKLNQVFQ